MLRRMLLLNGLATLAVVLYHASSWGFIAMFWWTDRYLPVSVPNFDQMGTVSYYGLRAIEQLIAFGVPAFLFVSGYFVSFASASSTFAARWPLVSKRVKALILPFLIWSIVFLSADVIQGEITSALDFVKRLVSGRAADPFYYVLLLSQLYLLSPLMLEAAKRNARLFLVLTAIIQLGMHVFQYLDLVGVQGFAMRTIKLLTPAWLLTWRIFWFALGLVVALKLGQVKKTLARIKGILIPAVAMTALVGVFEWELLFRECGARCMAPQETLVDSLYAGGVILSFLAFDRLPIPFAAKVGQLGSKSFGVFLLHSEVLEWVSRVIYHIAPWILAHQIVHQPILIVLGLTIPLLLMAVVDRSPARPLYKALFG